MSEKDFFVVAIGASAGGLDAIQQLFDNIPNNTGMTFIIVQHLSPNFKSLMPELLTKHTGMQIYTSEDNLVIQPNCIYLNQKNKNLYIREDRLFLVDKSPQRDLNLPIDIFFHSLGEAYRDRAVGIVLSGTGSDGSRGIKSIKEAGGILMVQEPESAQFDGMPNSSIATGLVDFILPPEKIAEALTKIPNHQIYLAEQKEKSNRSIYYQILDLIYEQTSINFKEYRKNSLLRRLEKQMNIHNFSKLSDYLAYLKENLDEVEVLTQDILIGVTGFFRDEEAFSLLEEKVMPVLCKKHINTKTPIRIWVPGCSTGEEVFTIAFLFDDYIRRERLHVDFKIFATDINDDALRKAGAAVYSLDSVKELPARYIDMYFTEDSGEMTVIKRIRDRIVFSRHNLLKDPPFIRIDLISCRNLLIYIESKVQERVLKNFQFSLQKGAYLLLGNSESLGHQASSFETINSKWNIYRCVTDTKCAPVPSVLEERLHVVPARSQELMQIQKFEYRFKQHPENAFYKLMGQEFSPAMVFTDANFNILFVNGDITTRLAVSQGVFQGNLLKLVSGEIATIIRSGIRKAEQQDAEVIVTNVINEVGAQKYCFDLGFRKITDFEDFNTVYIIHFSKDKQHEPNKRIVIDNAEADEINRQRISELEEELKNSKSQLQYMVEQLETSNEELQSSNEELMASNEELQSTNEELQSVNEELYTVNTELQETNKELSCVNNDINNLLNSTEIGTLFLNVDLRIRKFTPALQKHFNLQIEDVGRSIASFASNFNEGDSKSMLEDCRAVLADLRVKEAQLCDHEGQHFLRRISPFITADKKIEGLVITFVNIKQVVEIQNKLAASEERYKGLLANTEIGVVVHNNKGDILLNNPKASDLLGLSEEQMRGKKALDPYWKFVYEDNTVVPLDHYPVMRVIKTKKMLTNRVLGVIRNKNNILWLMVNGFPVFEADGEIKEVFISFVDVTEHKKAEKQIIQEKKFAERIANTSTNGIFIYDIQKKKSTFFNNRCTDILGYTLEEINVLLLNEELFSLFHPDDLEAVKEHVRLLVSGKKYMPIEFRFKHKDGRWVWCYFLGSPFETDRTGEVVSFIGSFIDLSDKKAFEEELRNAKQKAEIANIYKNQFLANMSHEIRTPLNSVMGFADLLNEDEITPETRKKYITIIKDSSNQLLNLVNDIIDVSKIEANELKLNLGSCNLNLLFLKLKTTFIEIQKQKYTSEIKLQCTLPEEQDDLNVETDSLRLWQVMSNLIGNALKYSEKGIVEFGYEIPDENTILFFVKDQGVGIPEEKLDSIFNRFERLKTENSVLPDGVGLGLAISRGIINLLHGEIHVTSEVGKGTNFTFTMPLAKVQKNDVERVADISLPDEEKTEKLRLLAADDCPLNTTLLKALFNKLPHDVSYVENGLQAVEFYRENPDVDIVLMDIRMPVMDGVDAVQKILEFDPDARVIAQTAHAMHDDSRKYLEMGFVDYISKPIDREKLLQMLNRLGKKKISPH